MAYRVKLHIFEGPLDLLLFLIKKNEVDIYDIPIAEITRQYLEYVELIKLFDLESASEYIYLAATLIRIKAKMLLPKPETDEEEEEADPRMELVQRLLEYKRFKDLTPFLSEKESVQRNFYPRRYFRFDLPEEEEHVEDSLNEVSLFQLMEVFKKVIEKVPEPTFHRVEVISVTLEEQIDFILSHLVEKSQILFGELMEHFRDRITMIITFIALLELVKRNVLFIKQINPFGDIWIQKV